MQRFHKYHGAGNDFIFFEDQRDSFPKEKIPFLCQRNQGIGADGVILVQKSSRADAKMAYFNADGGQVALCGNGLRCLVQFLRDQGQIQDTYTIEVGGKLLTATVQEGTIFTTLPPTRLIFWELGKMYVVDTGVAHAVLFANRTVDVVEEGRKIRFDPRFAPEGVNVNFVEVVDEHTLSIRTYERGVENETLACGTGAAACAFVANWLGFCKETVDVITKSKEHLTIRLGPSIAVGGPCVKVFEGVITL